MDAYEERRAGAANDRNGQVAPYVRDEGIVLTSSLVLARSSREWSKVMAILMMVPCGLAAILLRR